jgi:hypothetical protein
MHNQPGMEFVRGVQAMAFADTADALILLISLQFLIQEILDRAVYIATVFALCVIDISIDAGHSDS